MCAVSWRCCFAVWLRLPGEPALSCAGSRCALASGGRGRASLVPGLPASAGSAAALRLSLSSVGARRRVCLRWLRLAGLPAGWCVSSVFALPFPSVLVRAGWRARRLLWFWCALSRGLFSRWLASGCRG